jgi:copper chaperone
MEKETLNVKGMSCGHCISSIEGSVGGLKGVSHVKVNLDQGTVYVEYDANMANREQIIEAIDDQGYDVA